MAPVWQGSILGLLAFVIVIAVWAAVRKIRADDEFFAARSEPRRESETPAPWAGRSEDDDVFAPMRTPGERLPDEDVERILIACAAEARCVAKHVRRAQTTLSVEDYGDELRLAERKIEGVIRCVEALVERLRDNQTTRQSDDENFPPVVPAPDLAKTAPAVAAQAATDTGAAGGKFYKSCPGEPSYDELAHVVRESAAYMSGVTDWEDAARINRLICEAAAKLPRLGDIESAEREGGRA